MTTGLAVGAVSYWRASAALESAAKSKLEAVRDTRKAALEEYLRTIHDDIVLFASDPTVLDTLLDFRNAWQSLGKEPARLLHKLYIKDNPHPVGRKEQLHDAGDDSDYSRVHTRVHPWFKNLIQQKGYYDVLLISPDGNVVYSTVKEVDFATNLYVGPYKGTGLGRVFRLVVAKQHPRIPEFEDFSFFVPSNNQAAGFVAMPVFLPRGELLAGVLVLQMPIGRINGIMRGTAGMGETGESNLIGPDFLMRTDSREFSESTLLRLRMEDDYIKTALAGTSGVVEGPDHHGIRAFLSFAPFNFLGKRWVIVTDIHADEVFAPIRGMLAQVMMYGLLALALTTLIGLLMSQRIVASLSLLSDAVERFGKGKIAPEDIPLGGNDEVGRIGRKFKAMAGNIRDYYMTLEEEIADRTKAEEDLRDSEERKGAILHAALDAIITIDTEGKVVEFNPAAEEVFGYGLGEVLGKDLADLIIPPQLRDKHTESLARFVATGKGNIIGQRIEVPALRADGSEFPVELTITPIRRSEQLLFTAFIRDITELKKAEESQKQFSAELEKRVLDRTKKLRRQITERKRAERELQYHHDQLEKIVELRTAHLVAANEDIKDFAYTVSHDLRAPLVNLKGFVGELRQSMDDISPLLDAAISHLDEEQQNEIMLVLKEDVPEAMTFIESSTAKMDGLISAVLKLSRLGRREISPEEIEMNQLAEETVKTMAFQIEEIGAEVRLAKLPPMVGDRMSIEQVFSNLLSNAVKYLDHDRPGIIEVSGERVDGETLIHVRDNGRGIAEADLPKVFEIFRRLGKRDRPGEGMGLAYVKTLLRRQYGRIWCESKLGEGSTFSFSLPDQQLSQGDG